MPLSNGSGISPLTGETGTEIAKRLLQRQSQPLCNTSEIIIYKSLTAATLLSACLATGHAQAQDATTAKGSVINSDAKEIGSIELTETPVGVLINTDVTDLPAGEHGFHLHAVGKCDPGNFKSADGHANPDDVPHGYFMGDAIHAGDMPNQFVSNDGKLRSHVLNYNVTMEDNKPDRTSLFDADGAALIIHSEADDYKSQPSGAAGERIACAVIEKQ